MPEVTTAFNRGLIFVSVLSQSFASPVPQTRMQTTDHPFGVPSRDTRVVFCEDRPDPERAG